MAAAQGNPLETELNTYRAIQKEIGKVQGNISTAQTQILENEMVLKECIPLSRYGLLKARGRRVPMRGRELIAYTLPRSLRRRSSSFSRRTRQSSS